jgi:hypothetical protein
MDVTFVIPAVFEAFIMIILVLQHGTLVETWFEAAPILNIWPIFMRFPEEMNFS